MVSIYVTTCNTSQKIINVLMVIMFHVPLMKKIENRIISQSKIFVCQNVFGFMVPTQYVHTEKFSPVRTIAQQTTNANKVLYF